MFASPGSASTAEDHVVGRLRVAAHAGFERAALLHEAVRSHDEELPRAVGRASRGGGDLHHREEDGCVGRPGLEEPLHQHGAGGKEAGWTQIRVRRGNLVGERLGFPVGREVLRGGSGDRHAVVRHLGPALPRLRPRVGGGGRGNRGPAARSVRTARRRAERVRRRAAARDDGCQRGESERSKARLDYQGDDLRPNVRSLARRGRAPAEPGPNDEARCGFSRYPLKWFAEVG